MRVKAKYAQQPRQSGQVAVYHAFKVGHAAATSVVEVFATQQAQADDDVDRRDDIAFVQKLGDDALDPWEHRVVAECVDRDLSS